MLFDIYLLINSDSPEQKAMHATVLQEKSMNISQEEENETPNLKLDENRFVLELPCAQHSKTVRLFSFTSLLFDILLGPIMV